jgi:hypothetical protein
MTSRSKAQVGEVVHLRHKTPTLENRDIKARTHGLAYRLDKKPQEKPEQGAG